MFFAQIKFADQKSSKIYVLYFILNYYSIPKVKMLLLFYGIYKE